VNTCNTHGDHHGDRCPLCKATAVKKKLDAQEEAAAQERAKAVKEAMKKLPDKKVPW
jgi:hypothetical protein